MFGLSNKKSQLVAPVNGTVITLQEVPDPIFAQKILGDGVAIEISDDVVCAPIDGTLEMIFHTNHAFALKTKDGVEILVHIGINTVQLDGKGFERLAKEGQSIKAGTPVIRVNRKLVQEAGFSLVTPVVITSFDKVEEFECYTGKEVLAGKDVIVTYQKK